MKHIQIISKLFTRSRVWIFVVIALLAGFVVIVSASDVAATMSGCYYNNPACDSDHACIKNKCVPKEGPYTLNGLCNTPCGSFLTCAGKAIGDACVFGQCNEQCQCLPPPDPDDDMEFCLSLGYEWAAAGERKPFGEFSQTDIDTGKEECVGDDPGEHYRFRQCGTVSTASGCLTDANDDAACASQNSCVLESKCFTRLDKTYEEDVLIQQNIQQGQEGSDAAGLSYRELAGLFQTAATTGDVPMELWKRWKISAEISSKLRQVHNALGINIDQGNRTLGISTYQKNALLCVPLLPPDCPYAGKEEACVGGAVS